MINYYKPAADKNVSAKILLRRSDAKEQIYDRDYQLTAKKKIIRFVLIFSLSLVTLAALYFGLFVLDLGEIPAKSVSSGGADVLSDDLLSFRLKSDDCYLTDDCGIKTLENGNDVVYFTVHQPIIPKRVTRKKAGAGPLSEKNYSVYIKGISAVYYVGGNAKDRVLIWKR